MAYIVQDVPIATPVINARVTLRRMSAAERGVAGARLVLSAGIHDSRFGPVLVVTDDQGICAIQFVSSLHDDPITLSRQIWPAAQVLLDVTGTAAVAASLGHTETTPLVLHVEATDFQLAVWQALLRLPPGVVTSYARLAAALDCPGAARAVGGAVAANPVALLIPCHRVVRESGEPGGYAWGVARKQAILQYEGAPLST